MKDNRVVCRRNSTYRTKSNKYRKLRAPGGRLTTLLLKKKVGGNVCADSGAQIHGIPHVNPSKLPPAQRTVSRAYGGNLCGRVVRERILQSFLAAENRTAERLRRATAKKQAGNAAKKAAKGN